MSFSRVPKLLVEASELPADERHEEWIEEITWRAEHVLRGESNGRAVDDAELAEIFYEA